MSVRLTFLGGLGDGTMEDQPLPVAVAEGSPFREIAAGTESTCAIALDDEAYCWGGNWVGQLGDGTTQNSTTPVLVLFPW